MWKLIESKQFPPTRIFRYCCEVLKEGGGAERFITTGVRWSESSKRKNRGIFETSTKQIKKRTILMSDNDDKRMLFENCRLKARRICNPIIDWTNSDIWEYIESESIQTNPLYQCGFHRVGCIGCPMAGPGRWHEFARYPTYQKAYIRAFEKMLEAIHKSGKTTKWKNGYDVFLWWMEDRNMEGQMGMQFDDSMNFDGYKEVK